MRISDLQTGAGLLRQATTRLKDQWDATAETWQDETRRAFARDRLDPLLPEVSLMLVAVQELAELLDDAARECRDPASPTETESFLDG